MSIKNEAFIDLENSLTRRLNRVWGKQWGTISKQILEEIKAGNWDEAHKLADTIDFVEVFEKSEKFIRTVGMFSLLLGASRVATPSNSNVRKDSPITLLDSSVNHIRIILSENATAAVRREIHVRISTEEIGVAEEALKKTEAFPSIFRTTVQKSGEGYNSIASGLHVSRLNSAGFLQEAASVGARFYVVNEVLDSVTCPVCRTMHGKRFPVSAGANQMSMVLGSSDPGIMSTVSPWPRQDKESVKRLRRMDTVQLSENGLSLPPYHPNCRGIVSLVGAVPSLESLTALAVGVGVGSGTLEGVPLGDTTSIFSDAELLFNNPTSEALTNRLFGELSELGLIPFLTEEEEEEQDTDITFLTEPDDDEEDQ